MRDLMSKPKATLHSSGDASAANSTAAGLGQVESEKTKILSILSDDFCSSILDVSFYHMFKKENVNPGSSLSLGGLELWSDDFEGKGDFSQYRQKLVNVTHMLLHHYYLACRFCLSY